MKKYRCGLLFGSFDPIHEGHLRLIRRAKELCDIVVLCIDSDEEIRRTKNRAPMFKAIEREIDLLQLRDIKHVYWEDSEDCPKARVIEMVKPDVLIKGDDWKGKGWSGEGLDVPVLYLPYTKEITSTMFHEAQK